MYLALRFGNDKFFKNPHEFRSELCDFFIEFHLGFEKVYRGLEKQPDFRQCLSKFYAHSLAFILYQ